MFGDEIDMLTEIKMTRARLVMRLYPPAGAITSAAAHGLLRRLARRPLSVPVEGH